MLVLNVIVTPVQHTFLFSFKNARISNDLHIRLRLPVVISPQTEKILIISIGKYILFEFLIPFSYNNYYFYSIPILKIISTSHSYFSEWK